MDRAPVRTYRRGMLRDETGQASSEYAGILAVVAVVFVALFASGLAPTVADAAQNAVCAIIGGELRRRR